MRRVVVIESILTCSLTISITLFKDLHSFRNCLPLHFCAKLSQIFVIQKRIFAFAEFEAVQTPPHSMVLRGTQK